MYKHCLFNETATNASYYQIASENHSIRTKKIDKRALSSADTKRFLLADSFDTIAFGDYRIESLSVAPPRTQEGATGQ